MPVLTLPETAPLGEGISVRRALYSRALGNLLERMDEVFSPFGGMVEPVAPDDLDTGFAYRLVRHQELTDPAELASASSACLQEVITRIHTLSVPMPVAFVKFWTTSDPTGTLYVNGKFRERDGVRHGKERRLLFGHISQVAGIESYIKDRPYIAMGTRLVTIPPVRNPGQKTVIEKLLTQFDYTRAEMGPAAVVKRKPSEASA